MKDARAPDEQALWRNERSFWTAGRAFYADHLAADAVMALPPPAGVLDRAQVIRSIANAPRWREVEFEDAQAWQPDDRTMLLAYRACADRGGADTRYRARVLSVYVRDGNGDWALAYHRQVPQAAA